MRSLVLQYIPHSEVGDLNSEAKIRKILRIVRQDRIALMEGRLSTEEEASLIELTMGEIDKKFRGVEVATVNPDALNTPISKRVITGLFELFMGKRGGMTVVGPASIIKEIKRDPNRIQLYMNTKRK